MKNRSLRLPGLRLTCCTTALLSLSIVSAQTAPQLPRPKAAAPASASLIEDLVTAYRILAAEGIVGKLSQVDTQ